MSCGVRHGGSEHERVRRLWHRVHMDDGCGEPQLVKVLSNEKVFDGSPTAAKEGDVETSAV